MIVMNHNWSTRKQRLYPQSAAGISRHSALSEDRVQQCGTSSESQSAPQKLSDSLCLIGFSRTSGCAVIVDFYNNDAITFYGIFG